MIISLIAAMAENRVIGKAQSIPWDLPDDRKRFRELTWGHPVIMGRKTFESVGRPLPGRKNIVLTRDRDYRLDGCLTAHDLESALEQAEGSDEIFVCGGFEVYREAMPIAGKIYLTVIHRNIAGDILFPEIPPDFAEVSREFVPAPVPHTFIVYKRVA